MSKLKQELQNKETYLQSQIAVLSEQLQQVVPAALFQSIHAAPYLGGWGRAMLPVYLLQLQVLAKKSTTSVLLEILLGCTAVFVS